MEAKLPPMDEINYCLLDLSIQYKSCEKADDGFPTFPIKASLLYKAIIGGSIAFVIARTLYTSSFYNIIELNCGDFKTINSSHNATGTTFLYQISLEHLQVFKQV